MSRNIKYTLKSTLRQSPFTLEGVENSIHAYSFREAFCVEKFLQYGVLYKPHFSGRSDSFKFTYKNI